MSVQYLYWYKKKIVGPFNVITITNDSKAKK